MVSATSPRCFGTLSVGLLDTSLEGSSSTRAASSYGFRAGTAYLTIFTLCFSTGSSEVKHDERSIYYGFGT